MSTETTKKKIKIDNGTEFARVYTDKEVDNKLSSIGGGSDLSGLSLHFDNLGNHITTNGLTLVSNWTPDDTLENLKGLGQVIHFSFINDNPVFGNDNKYYAPGELNNTDTIKYLGCANGEMFWSEIDNFSELYVVEVTRTQEGDNYYLNVKYNDTYVDKISLITYKQINLFGNHSILVPNASTDTAINLYNHFIKITGTDGDKKIVIRFTIQSSKDTAINTIDNLSTLLGNEFELGCSGIYSTYNITGLKKTTDGALNIIYNNGGAESLLNTTGITLTISDIVKII